MGQEEKGAQMRLKVEFLEGELRPDCVGYVADFELEAKPDAQCCDTRGIHIGGHELRHPFFRISYICVIRQHDHRKTLKVLAHELIHSAIWLLHLPIAWSDALDGNDLTPQKWEGITNGGQDAYT